MRTATPGKPAVLVGGDIWASCSITEFGHVGMVRHIIRPGALTTVCGASASHPDVWRRNRAKPRCGECVDRYRKEENR